MARRAVYPGYLSFASELDPVVKKEMLAQKASSRRFLAQEHKATGAHGDVTADSLDVSGDVDVEGDLDVHGSVGFEDLSGDDIVTGTIQADVADLGAVTAASIADPTGVAVNWDLVSSDLQLINPFTSVVFFRANTAGVTLANNFYLRGTKGAASVVGLIGVNASDKVSIDPDALGVVMAGLFDLSGASAGQIKFPASQNASTNANTLDDYEEGTWTPVDASGAGLALTVNGAGYVKIGKLVVVQFDLQYPATADVSAASIGGLPFTLTAGAAGNASIGCGYSTFGAGIALFAGGGSTAITPYSLAGANITNLQLSGIRLVGTVPFRASA